MNRVLGKPEHVGGLPKDVYIGAQEVDERDFLFVVFIGSVLEKLVLLVLEGIVEIPKAVGALARISAASGKVGLFEDNVHSLMGFLEVVISRPTILSWGIVIIPAPFALARIIV
ncbi:hypothetical protein GUJ93_ZPchr0008g14025 [Zizania palustris]|uniref:Uncharacterized protein n=1 Tax=Zizania palustris TaxID=103762 RepID=A0A8J5VHL2_ZIZPA|nr:hypothetical protein GUJ93_ZPchr0008g14025 [Zizania palustris]